MPLATQQSDLPLRCVHWGKGHHCWIGRCDATTSENCVRTGDGEDPGRAELDERVRDRRIIRRGIFLGVPLINVNIGLRIMYYAPAREGDLDLKSLPGSEI